MSSTAVPAPTQEIDARGISSPLHILRAHRALRAMQPRQVLKVLTVIATIFMPLTVLTGLYGMNVRLPYMPGGDTAQFWEIVVMMLVISGGMIWVFRKRGWV